MPFDSHVEEANSYTRRVLNVITEIVMRENILNFVSLAYNHIVPDRF
jgi:hypothetical protein